MSIFKDVLQEEYQRLQALKDKYNEELEKLPKGSISAKNRNNQYYYYLAYRVKDKVKFKYIGKKDSEALSKIEEQLSKRKEIESKLEQVNNAIKDLSKSVNG